MSYAATTDVPVKRSRDEIERLLSRYGATKFMVGSDQTRAVLFFEVKNRMVQFELPLPDKHAKVFWQSPARHYRRTETQAYQAWEQACRSRWRALRLCIQAKLEAVKVGITSFESEFLAHFVMSDGRTFGQHVIPRLDEVATGAPALPWFGTSSGSKPT